MQRGVYYLIILLAGLALIAASGMAAEDLTVIWNQTYGGPDAGEAAYAIVACPDGTGFFLAGETASFGEGGTDAWVVRLTPEGDEVWNRTYGGSEADTARSIIRTGDGNLLVAGNLTFVTDGARLDTDAWLIKIDPSGAEVWNRTYGGPDVNASASAVIEIDDDGYLFVGSIAPWGEAGSDAWVVRLNESGGTVWERRLGGDGVDTANAVTRLPDGDLIFAGSTGSWGAGGSDAWVVRLDGSGGEVWNKTFGGPGDDGARAVINTTDGNLLIAGTFTERSGNETPDTDALLIKLTPDGDILWNWIYGDVGVNESANAVIETYDGGYVFAGDTGFPGVDDTDAWLVGTDSEGAVAGSKTFGGINPGDRATSLLQVGEDDYIFAGVFNATGKEGVVNEDAWAVRLGVPTEPAPKPTTAPIKPPKAPVVHQKPAVTAPPTHKPTVTLTVAPTSPPSIGGLVWNDTDADGIHGPGEPGIEGANVTLLYADLHTTEMTGTGADGGYLFANLTPGDYVVEFTPPEGMAFTVQGAGDGDTRGSDADQTTGRTGVITLKTGEEQLQWDAGMVVEAPPPGGPGLVTGTVWFATGYFDEWSEGVPALSGARVELMSADDALVDTTFTGDDGVYTFSVDEPGRYYLRFVPPRKAGGLVFSPSGPENNVDPGTGKTSIFDLTPPGTVTQNAMLISGSPPLSGVVWCDLNGNGIRDPGEPGIPDTCIMLLDYRLMPIGRAFTGPDGSYHFPALRGYRGYDGIEVHLLDGYACTVPGLNNNAVRAGESVAFAKFEGGDFIEIEGETLNVGLTWIHQTETPAEAYGWIRGITWIDWNQDGLREEAEQYGLADVEVQLLDAGGAVIATARTKDAFSLFKVAYIFGPLPPGEYSLIFTPPENYVFTDQGRDSHVDPETGIVAPFTVGGNEIVTRDAGLVHASVLKPTPETTPEATPDLAPEPTSDLASEPAPETTPELTPEQAPGATPDLTPEPASDLTSEPAPETTPELTPEQAPGAVPDLTSPPWNT